MNNTCIIILAAGKGSRMNSSKPKVLHEVGGLPIIQHIVNSTVESSARQTICVVSNQQVADVVQNTDIVYQDKQLGTGDAVIQALPHVKDDIEYLLVLYGDTPLISSETIQASIQKCINDNAGITVLAINTITPSNTLGSLKVSPEGQVEAIVEYCDCENQKELKNVGIIVKKDIAQKILPTIEMRPNKNEIFLTDIVSKAHKEGIKCTYVECPTDEMVGINTMHDLCLVEHNFQTKMKERFLKSGVYMPDFRNVHFAYDTVIEPDVIIHPYVVFGPGVTVKSGSIIESFSHISNATIDNAKVGPFARIRGKSEIKQGARIGNFVEIKNTSVGEGSKISHLSYIGDTAIGESSNIGAGCITCNFDGFKKHHTNIGNKVFVGSNSSLIAPVNIGDEAIVAAGSVITKDVDPSSIAISRSQQENKTSAAAKYRNKKRG